MVAFRVSRAAAAARVRPMQKGSHRGRASTQTLPRRRRRQHGTEELGWQNFAPYSKSVVVTAAAAASDGFCTARLMCIEIAGVIFYRHRRRRHSLSPSLLSSFYMDSHCNPPPPLAAAATTERVRPSVRPEEQPRRNPIWPQCRRGPSRRRQAEKGRRAAASASIPGNATGGRARAVGRAGGSLPSLLPLPTIFLPRLRSNGRNAAPLCSSLLSPLSLCVWRPLSSIPTALTTTTTTTSFSCPLPPSLPSYSPISPFFPLLFSFYTL